jgi:XTP/dITP diphosphohydrolase
MPLTKLLIASNNHHKMTEFRRLFDHVAVDLLSPYDINLNLDVDETGDTFEANARLKARAFAKASGLLALADDSGIEIDALEGRPGVLSARYGGEGLDDAGRVQRLLQEMVSVPDDQRACRYRVVLVLVDPAEPEVAEESTEARCEGQVARQISGKSGFGYDPIFYLPGYGKTIAEISADQKDEISHRGIAARAMAEILAARTA